jgi:hypothetical protein
MTPKSKPGKSNFYLSKWFLDVIGPNGEAYIFYAAELKWHALTVHYTSSLQYTTAGGVHSQSRFSHVKMPVQTGNSITWADERMGVSGRWEARSPPIEARIFESDEGCLDWFCYQPAATVTLHINETVLQGSGYAEQLVLTAPPWIIPMDELRWGRFGSDAHTLVWIELRHRQPQQWLWYNNEPIHNCVIGDEQLLLPDQQLVLELNRSTVLESEKKIFSVVQSLIRFLPGFNKVMPLKFLMADETKWLSGGRLFYNGAPIAEGSAIHEWVHFQK